MLQGFWALDLAGLLGFLWVPCIHPAWPSHTLPLGAADPSLLWHAEWSPSHFQEGSLSKSQPPLLGTISLPVLGPRLEPDSSPEALGTEVKPDPKR